MNEFVQQDLIVSIQKRTGGSNHLSPKNYCGDSEAGEATGVRRGRSAASDAEGGDVDSFVARYLSLSVENVQDIVEEVLLASPYRRTAKAYIIYRDQHARLREMVRKADVDLIDSYLGRVDWRVRENSNMAYSLQGLNNYISSEVSKVYWLNKIYPAEIREAHDNGAMHLHDLGLLSVYCVGWDLQDLLRSGFKGVAGKAESLPAKHFRTALGQIVNFFYTIQGEPPVLRPFPTSIRCWHPCAL